MNSALASESHDDWKSENRAGLGFAGTGDWAQALEAFERAMSRLTVESQAVELSPDELDATRAVLLSNLCQAATACEKFAEAQRYAEKSLSLRVGLYGESALSVARARSDLAVVLARSGRTNDALSLLQRAIAPLEAHAALHHSHKAPLALLRENATRIRNASNERSAGFADGVSVMDSLPEVATHLDHIIGDAADDVVFDLVEPPPATLNSLPRKAPSTTRANPLGFDVEYGIPREHHEPLPAIKPADPEQ